MKEACNSLQCAHRNCERRCLFETKKASRLSCYRFDEAVTAHLKHVTA